MTESMTLLVELLVAVLFVVFGGLLGAQIQDGVHESERRCRALARRRQAEELQRLAAYAEACEDEMRWQTKGGRVFDDEDDERDDEEAD